MKALTTVTEGLCLVSFMVAGTILKTGSGRGPTWVCIKESWVPVLLLEEMMSLCTFYLIYMTVVTSVAL